MKPHTVSFPDELYEKIEKLAGEHYSSFSAAVLWIVADWFRATKIQHGVKPAGKPEVPVDGFDVASGHPVEPAPTEQKAPRKREKNSG